MNDSQLVSCSGGSLPVTRFVPPLQKVEFEIVYEGKLPSTREEDIIAKADFTERVTGTRHSTQRDWLTSVMVELEAVDVAHDNPCQNRHVMGVHEWVNYRQKYGHEIRRAINNNVWLDGVLQNEEDGD